MLDSRVVEQLAGDRWDKKEFSKAAKNQNGVITQQQLAQLWSRHDAKAYGGYAEVTLLMCKDVPYPTSMFSSPIVEAGVWYKGACVGTFQPGPKEVKPSGGRLKIISKTSRPTVSLWLSGEDDGLVEVRVGTRGSPSSSIQVRLFDYANFNVEAWFDMLQNQQPGGKIQIGVWFAPKHPIEDPPTSPGLLARTATVSGNSVVQLSVHSAEGLVAAATAGVFSSKKTHSNPFVVVRGLVGDNPETDVVKKSCDPVWDFDCVGYVPQSVHEILLDVKHKGTLTTPTKSIGRVALSVNALLNSCVSGDFPLETTDECPDASGTLKITIFIGARPRAIPKNQMKDYGKPGVLTTYVDQIVKPTATIPMMGNQTMTGQTMAHQPMVIGGQPGQQSAMVVTGQQSMAMGQQPPMVYAGHQQPMIYAGQQQQFPMASYAGQQQQVVYPGQQIVYAGQQPVLYANQQPTVYPGQQQMVYASQPQTGYSQQQRKQPGYSGYAVGGAGVMGGIAGYMAGITSSSNRRGNFYGDDGFYYYDDNHGRRRRRRHRGNYAMHKHYHGDRGDKEDDDGSDEEVPDDFEEPLPDESSPPVDDGGEQDPNDEAAEAVAGDEQPDEEAGVEDEPEEEPDEGDGEDAGDEGGEVDAYAACPQDLHDGGPRGGAAGGNVPCGPRGTVPAPSKLALDRARALRATKIAEFQLDLDFPMPEATCVHLHCLGGGGASDISIATQCSMDRLDKLEAMTIAWAPASVVCAVHLPHATSREFTELRELHARHAATLHLILRTEHATPSSWASALYPINALRNAAIDAVKSSLAFILDVDFIPSRGAHDRLCRAMAALEADKSALVVPAFELDAKCPMPLGRKLDVRDAVRDGTAEGFHMSGYSKGHAPTHFERWLTDSDSKPYRVLYQEGFEPYVVVDRTRSRFPRFDERFRGYGLNKVAHAYAMAARSFDYYVANDVWLVAHGHAKTQDWHRIYDPNHSEYDKTQRLRIQALYNSFKQEIRDKTRSDESSHPTTPPCRNQNKATKYGHYAQLLTSDRDHSRALMSPLMLVRVLLLFALATKLCLFFTTSNNDAAFSSLRTAQTAFLAP